MIHEIYTRAEDDPNYAEMLETNNALEIALSKIRMILGTNHGEVLGEYDLGTNIEELVFKTERSAKDIESELERQITTYIGNVDGYIIKIKVKFGHHKDGYDYAEIGVNVNDLRIQTYLVD